MKTVAGAAIFVALMLAFVYVQTAASQLFYDSCRKWREPPVWRVMCPPSTRHGAT